MSTLSRPGRLRHPLWPCLLFALLLAACSRPVRGEAPLPTLVAPAVIPLNMNNDTSNVPPPPTYTPAPQPVALVEAIPSPTLPPTPTPIPPPTATAEPYAELMVDGLAARSYGAGTLEITQEVGQTATFTRYFFSYPSDGLQVHGFMNVPHGDGPFPVVVALHGYVEPEEYETLDYTARYADSLAANGFLVLHPNYRNHPPSDEGPNPLRLGYAVDTLNLIALVQQQAGRPGPLEKAQPGPVHLWGHSMGGGIALRVLVASPLVRSAVLYASMSGDEYRNFERISFWSGGERGKDELALPPEIMARVAPIHFLGRITAAVSIHHGTADAMVPLNWSLELCEELRALGKSVECFTYTGQQHNFAGDGDQLFRQRVLDFYRRH